MTTAKGPPLFLIDIATLATLSPDDLAAVVTELRAGAARDGFDVQIAVDVTCPSDVATLKRFRCVWPDVTVLEFVGP